MLYRSRGVQDRGIFKLFIVEAYVVRAKTPISGESNSIHNLNAVLFDKSVEYVIFFKTPLLPLA